MNDQLCNFDERTKTLMPDSPGLVDFILLLSYGQVKVLREKFWGKFK